MKFTRFPNNNWTLYFGWFDIKRFLKKKKKNQIDKIKAQQEEVGEMFSLTRIAKKLFDHWNSDVTFLSDKKL